MIIIKKKKYNECMDYNGNYNDSAKVLYVNK